MYSPGSQQFPDNIIYLLALLLYFDCMLCNQISKHVLIKQIKRPPVGFWKAISLVFLTWPKKCWTLVIRWDATLTFSTRFHCPPWVVYLRFFGCKKNKERAERFTSFTSTVLKVTKTTKVKKGVVKMPSSSKVKGREKNSLSKLSVPIYVVNWRRFIFFCFKGFSLAAKRHGQVEVWVEKKGNPAGTVLSKLSKSSRGFTSNIHG